MIIKIKINKETLECISDDNSVIINHVLDLGDQIEIELSKPDPEQEMTGIPWQ
jgi:hypothetical protein